ncbi:MAG: Major facilitator superfamily protein [Labilithrix sp.]|nr:Major facilitator superfamily protein [Labilithrix sp.]
MDGDSPRSEKLKEHASTVLTGNEGLASSVSIQGAAGSTVADAVALQVPVRTTRLTSIAVASALFMEFIDSTALSTALPTLSRAFHTDPLHLKLALTSYILALAVLAPASGWVADRFGPKRVFMLAMTVFLAGSVLCGFSHSLAQLVVFRLLQGAGGAMMIPVGRLIIVSTTPKNNLVSAMAWFTMPGLIGPILGPPLAGIVLGVTSWPWIFFINIPVCIGGLLLVGTLVPASRPPDPGRFDTVGFAYAALAVTLFVGSMETAGVDVIPGYVQAAGIAASVVLTILYVRHAKRSVRPILDLSLFRLPTFRASVVGGTLVRLGVGAGPLLLPLLLQVALGWSPLKAGLISVWQSVGALTAKPATSWVLHRFGFRRVLIVTVCLSAGFAVLPGFFRQGTPLVLMILVFVLSGFSRSNQFTAANTVAYADVPAPRVSAASTLSTVTQQVGLSLGISFGGLVLHLATGSGGALTPDRFVLPYLAVGATTLLAVASYVRLPAGAGSSLA